MWIFTRYGFFSVVVGKDDVIMIRARVKKHLTNLMRGVGVEAAIQESTKTDYRYRMIVTRRGWERIMESLAEELDWPNFKAECHKWSDWLDEPYIRSLHKVWSMMQALQEPSYQQFKKGIEKQWSASKTPTKRASRS